MTEGCCADMPGCWKGRMKRAQKQKGVEVRMQQSGGQPEA